MIVALTLLIISFLAMVAMLYFKRVEIRTGRQYLFFNERTDQWVEHGQQRINRFFYRWNFRTISLYYDFLLTKLENVFLSLYRYIRKRFDRPINMVKGRGDDENNK
jgi:hypothetical protein